MKTYKLYVCMPIAKFSAEVVADYFSIKDNRISFYTESNTRRTNELIASYPSKYTIIETITENK